MIEFRTSFCFHLLKAINGSLSVAGTVLLPLVHPQERERLCCLTHCPLLAPSCPPPQPIKIKSAGRHGNFVSVSEVSIKREGSQVIKRRPQFGTTNQWTGLWWWVFFPMWNFFEVVIVNRSICYYKAAIL